MKIRILHIITSLSVGGAEQSLYRLLLNIDNSKYSVAVVSLTGTGVFSKKIENLGIDVYACNMEKSLRGILGLFTLVKIIKNFKPDIVQTWLYHSDLIGGVVARLLGIRNIIWGIRSTELKRNSRFTVLIRFVCAKLSSIIPKKIVVVAEAAKYRHIELGYCKSNMQVIPNGFDKKDFSPNVKDIQLVRNSLGINNSIVIGAVGRFSHEKGHDVLIEASKIILEESPQVLFLLIGPDLDALNKNLISTIKQKSDLSKFILAGERTDIDVCMQVMDIFCLPSRTEGFPNVLGEAMLSGVPCVATDVGDVSLLGGDDILLSKVDDPKDLAKKIITIMNFTKNKRNKIGLRLMDRIVSHYAINITINKYYSLYDELLKENV